MSIIREIDMKENKISMFGHSGDRYVIRILEAKRRKNMNDCEFV